MHKLQVLLLCAGEGRRMFPLTMAKAKPALKVGDHSIVSRLIMQTYSIIAPHEIWVNVGYLASTILEEGHRLNLGGKLRFIYEPNVLGSFQTLIFLMRESPVDTLILHGDLVLSDRYISRLKEVMQRKSDTSFVVYHYRAARNSRSNLKIKNGFVTDFENDVSSKCSSNRIAVNSGIYFVRSRDIGSLNVNSSIAQLYPVGLSHIQRHGPIRAIHMGTQGRVSAESPRDLKRANSVFGKTF